MRGLLKESSRVSLISLVWKPIQSWQCDSTGNSDAGLLVTVGNCNLILLSQSIMDSMSNLMTGSWHLCAKYFNTFLADCRCCSMELCSFCLAMWKLMYLPRFDRLKEIPQAWLINTEMELFKAQETPHTIHDVVLSLGPNRSVLPVKLETSTNPSVEIIHLTPEVLPLPLNCMQPVVLLQVCTADHIPGELSRQPETTAPVCSCKQQSWFQNSVYSV